MSWSESLYGWLVYSALVSLVVLAIGSGVALLCRQPTRRLRIIELTLAGCLIAPWLGMIPGYPQLAIGWRHIGTGALVDEKTHSADRPLAENMDLSPSAVPQDRPKSFRKCRSVFHRKRLPLRRRRQPKPGTSAHGSSHCTCSAWRWASHGG